MRLDIPATRYTRNITVAIKPMFIWIAVYGEAEHDAFIRVIAFGLQWASPVDYNPAKDRNYRCGGYVYLRCTAQG